MTGAWIIELVEMAQLTTYSRGIASAWQARTPPIELTIVVPTFNEVENIEPLMGLLEAALQGIEWEAIFVDDDSPDGTAAKVRETGQANARVRCIHRIGRRGLSSAVIEGFLASSAQYLAVIDADLQHDEKLLPEMLASLKSEEIDIVIGTRYAPGGEFGTLKEDRVAMSRFATRLAHIVVPIDVSDPMSGFFMLRRAAFEQAVRRLSGKGFKVLLDILASTQTPYRFRELPYTFRERIRGQSKLDTLVVWEYLVLLLDKLIGKWLPIRFVLFSFVGGSGVLVHMSVLRLGLVFFSFPFAQAAGTVCAMTSNFVLNNILTYYDQRLRGFKFFAGLASFYAVCSIGAVANVGIASAIFEQRYSWWIAGLAGSVVGVVWNYAVSSVFTWRKKEPN